VVIRPWLQAFAWKTKTYSPDYIRAQVSTSKQQGGIGFLLWNARNDYSKPFAAMPVMTASADRYFGKRTVPVPAKVATAVDSIAPNAKPAEPLALPEAPAPAEQKNGTAAAPQQKGRHL
jgi:hypothetical protein